MVQSYVNHFGTAAMAGYSATLRIDGFFQLPLQSFNMTITTFVGQNIGARQFKRVKRGIFTAWLMNSAIILAGCIVLYFWSANLIEIFTRDQEVIQVGSSMLRQIYLMITVPMTNSLEVVFAGWPVTWVVCAVGMLIYYFKVDWLKERN